MKKRLTQPEAISGYNKDFGFNPDWKEQKAVCGYEHCIENMPLYEKESKECIRLGYFCRNTIPGVCSWKPCKANEEGARPDINRYIAEFGRSENGCPVFGHDCPGGKAMVEKCKKTLNDIPDGRIV